MKFLSSRDNPVFKRLRSLAEDPRMRRDEGATLIDGEHLLLAALDASWTLHRLILREDVLATPAVEGVLRALEQRGMRVDVLVMAPGLFNAISPVATPTGMLAEIPVPDLPQMEMNGDVLVLAGVQDAGNLGSLLRTALAAGVRQVWLDVGTTQAWSPKALRAGMGAQFGLAITEACDLQQRLPTDSRQILVTSLSATSRELYEFDLRAPVIWVFGSEGQGVPASIQALARNHVRIPMPGATESLNVAAAAAVCLFEQVRQRRCT